MSDSTEAASAPFDLGPGLYQYYSSQAELMLAQYENINRLLGPTHDWTHPGDFCEILLRDFLRRFLPPTVSVDKGFIYGRSTVAKEETHCPEIDILIHDNTVHQPLFRMGDFVIVLPQTVRGIIQVKRTLTKGTVEKALTNVVNAKQHLLNALWSKTPARGWKRDRGIPYGLPPQVFSAVLGFQDEVGDDLDFYKSALLEQNVRCHAHDRKGMEPTSMYVLPAFVGSLKSHFIYVDGPGNYINQLYYLYASNHGEPESTNVCVQMLLHKFYSVFLVDKQRMPPFAWPEGMGPLKRCAILEIASATFEEAGTVRLHRTDGYSFQFKQSTSAVTGDKYDFEVSGDGKLSAGNTLLQHNVVLPTSVTLRRGGKIEKYELVPGSGVKG